MDLVAEVAQRILLGAIARRMGWGAGLRGGLGPGPLHRSTQAFGAIAIAQYAGCRRLQSSHSADGATLFRIWTPPYLQANCFAD